jgi:hypothetical protein
VADHFRDDDRGVREIFDALVSRLEAFGPLTVYAQKTRIVFQVRVRFGSVVVRKRWLDVGLVLKRRADHPALRRYEFIPPSYHLHTFRVARAAQLDEAFMALAREAREVGCQRYKLSRSEAAPPRD